MDTALELRLPLTVVPCCDMTRTFPGRRGQHGERWVETNEALMGYPDIWWTNTLTSRARSCRSADAARCCFSLSTW